MGVLVLGAVLLERDASVLNGLALAALLILAVRPNDLADPGFQLSFAATAGIVLAPLPRGLVWGSLGVSIAAQDRKSTRLNSSHSQISYAVFCLKKKKKAE